MDLETWNAHNECICDDFYQGTPTFDWETSMSALEKSINSANFNETCSLKNLGESTKLSSHLTEQYCSPSQETGMAFATRAVRSADSAVDKQRKLGKPQILRFGVLFIVIYHGF